MLLIHLNRGSKNGIAVLPEKLFFPEPSGTIHFRISISHRDENETEEGIKRIGQALCDLL